MHLSKLKMFLVLNGFVAAALSLYLIVWISGNRTVAKIIPPHYSVKVAAVYQVNGNSYQAGYMRNDIPYTAREITIRYLSFAPSYSRVNSFMGIAAEPLAWWLVFFMASSMLLLTDNAVFSKGTRFRIHKNFPWIAMDEYFRLPWYYGDETSDNSTSFPKKDQLGNNSLT